MNGEYSEFEKEVAKEIYKKIGKKDELGIYKEIKSRLV